MANWHLAIMSLLVAALARPSLIETTVLAQPQPQSLQTAGDTRAFLDKYCVSCHDERAAASRAFVPSRLRLDDTDLSRIGQNREVWEKVVRKLRAGIEPNVPANAPHPDARAESNAAAWIEAELDRNAAPVLRPASSHPLNRTEYKNAIRDLLGLDVDVRLLLPPDQSTHGFDNITEALQSRGRDEEYKSAARKVSVMAMSAPARGNVFACHPAAPAEETACAEKITRNLATRAFRGPVSDSEVSALMDAYRSARGSEPSAYFNNYEFERGIEAVLLAVLSDPKFCYRIETEPASSLAGLAYRINGYELASRLSAFLWSGGPDDELLRLAGEGRLSDPAILDQQVRRMLQDPRAEALSLNFADQWLGLRQLAVVPQLDSDEPLRQAVRREAELFFDSIVREDRSVVDLLDADYTFLNERLARHYGIPNISGDQFRRVTLTAEFDVRRGLLGKAAVLTVTSRGNRPSITDRGKWVLSKLGAFPPDPPPNIQPLPLWNQNATNGPTFRQILDTSLSVRYDCANCHRIMDPIGIALENFDAVGAWRTHDAGLPVDASSELLDGTKLNGPADLRNALVARSDQFVRTLTENLLSYSLGHVTNYQDLPLVRSIVRDAAAENYRFSAIVLGIVRSAPFQMNVKR